MALEAYAVSLVYARQKEDGTAALKCVVGYKLAHSPEWAYARVRDDVAKEFVGWDEIHQAHYLVGAWHKITWRYIKENRERWMWMLRKRMFG